MVFLPTLCKAVATEQKADTDDDTRCAKKPPSTQRLVALFFPHAMGRPTASSSSSSLTIGATGTRIKPKQQRRRCASLKDECAMDTKSMASASDADLKRIERMTKAMLTLDNLVRRDSFGHSSSLPLRPGNFLQRSLTHLEDITPSTGAATGAPMTTCGSGGTVRDVGSSRRPSSARALVLPEARRAARHPPP